MFKQHWPPSTFACKCDVHRIFVSLFFNYPFIFSIHFVLNRYNIHSMCLGVVLTLGQFVDHFPRLQRELQLELWTVLVSCTSGNLHPQNDHHLPHYIMFQRQHYSRLETLDLLPARTTHSKRKSTKYLIGEKTCGVIWLSLPEMRDTFIQTITWSYCKEVKEECRTHRMKHRGYCRMPGKPGLQ